MTSIRTDDYLKSLIFELSRLPEETPWVEFKVNNGDPEQIGEYISALANSAVIEGKANSYIVWGIENDTHNLIGTSFNPNKSKVGGEELESWLLRLLSPKLYFKFYLIEDQGLLFAILEIPAATVHPVKFKNEEYIRVGSYKKKLRDHPEIERQLWRSLDKTPFEKGIALDRLSVKQIFDLLDIEAYCALLEKPLPEDKDLALDYLKSDGLISPSDAGEWGITNMGAILFAVDLTKFPSLSRKAMRVIQYKGVSRIETQREQEGGKGYATGFHGLIQFIINRLPANELYQQAIRKPTPMYPELAIRELVVNALIHQDFNITGAGPMVEIFDNRIEISNPGEPLVSVERFLDVSPRSRNEALASLLRRMGICEERGSGIDKVVALAEQYQLPAPSFEVTEGSTKAIMFSYRPVSEMDREDRVRSCYLHACLRYVNREYLTNTSLRERFQIDERNSATASRFIKEAVESTKIVPYDAAAAPKLKKYMPFWAKRT